MEEEEKETSGKAILCLKVHLLCYFFTYFDLLLEWKNTCLLESVFHHRTIFLLLCLCYGNTISLSWYFFLIFFLFLDLCFANSLSIKYNKSLLASNK